MATPRRISLRGYQVPLSTEDTPGGFETGYVDKALLALRERFVTDPGVMNTWGFHATTFEIAVRLLGRGLLNWVQLQANNPYVYGRNADFIKDTLGYIATGRRSVSLLAWSEMLPQQSEPGQQLGQPDSTRFDTHLTTIHQQLGSTSIDQVLDQWCSHPHGYRDLLGTLMILYGGERIIL